MRSATLTLILLLPVAGSSQGQASGHFEGSSGPSWGADKQTFDVKFGVRHVDAFFTVASNGFGWQQAFTNSKDTFRPWDEVVAWCWAPGTVLVRTRRDASGRVAVYDLQSEDLATIVDEYFKKHVAELEWRSSSFECTVAALNRPNPADLAKVRELLEAASAEKP